MKANFNRVLRRARREVVDHQRLVRDLVWSVRPEGRQNKKMLAELEGKFTGRRCFVMGNGPSLLKCNLSLLKDELTIGSNAQYLIWDTIGFVPTYLTVEDRLVAEDRAVELCNLNQPVKVFPRDLSYCLGESKNTVFINFVRDYKPFPRFTSEFAKIVYWGGTVTMLNLQLAYYLGCNEIYLIGFDHHYQVPNTMQDHVITSQADDVNHVHPSYFGKGYRWHDPNLARMEQSYAEARRFLNASGIIIKNATVGGQLEVFDRVDYDQLFMEVRGDSSGS